MRRLLTGLLGAALIVSACAGDDDGDDRAAVTSIPVETTTTSTSTTEARIPPVDVIPSDPALITEEYVENVLNALYEVSLQAIELARAEGVVDQPSIELIEATSSQELALTRINALIADAGEGFPDYPQELSPVTATVLEVIAATRECAFVEATFDSSGVSTAPDNSQGFRLFARIVAAGQEQMGSGLNPTAWVLDGVPATDDNSVPDETCP